MASYKADAEAYFECELPVGLCKKIFALEKINASEVQALTGQRSWQEIQKELQEMGYPI